MIHHAYPSVDVMCKATLGGTERPRRSSLVNGHIDNGIHDC